MGAAWDGVGAAPQRWENVLIMLVDVLVFVFVDECLIWYLCRYSVMSLLHHLFVSLSSTILASKPR